MKYRAQALSSLLPYKYLKYNSKTQFSNYIFFRCSLLNFSIPFGILDYIRTHFSWHGPCFCFNKPYLRITYKAEKNNLRFNETDILFSLLSCRPKNRNIACRCRTEKVYDNSHFYIDNKF